MAVMHRSTRKIADKMDNKFIEKQFFVQGGQSLWYELFNEALGVFSGFVPVGETMPIRDASNTLPDWWSSPTPARRQAIRQEYLVSGVVKQKHHSACYLVYTASGELLMMRRPKARSDNTEIFYPGHYELPISLMKRYTDLDSALTKFQRHTNLEIPQQYLQEEGDFYNAETGSWTFINRMTLSLEDAIRSYPAAPKAELTQKFTEKRFTTLSRQELLHRFEDATLTPLSVDVLGRCAHLLPKALPSGSKRPAGILSYQESMQLA